MSSETQRDQEVKQNCPQRRSSSLLTDANRVEMDTKTEKDKQDTQSSSNMQQKEARLVQPQSRQSGSGSGSFCQQNLRSGFGLP